MPLTQPAPPLRAWPLQARDLSLDDIHVGIEVTFCWQAEGDYIDRFAELSGDKNPLHMDEAYAREHGFGGRVVHGFSLGAQVSGLIGMVIPGRRCLLVEEKLSFPVPVYVGDEIMFRASVEEVHRELSLVILKVTARKTEQTVMRGRVTCKLLS